jgi:acyl carrier protein
MTLETIDQLVRQLVRDTLSLPADEPVRGDQLLFYDLAFTSLDFLDLLYRVEEHFGISIPEGTLYGLARGDVDDAAFADRGQLTPLGRDRLMALLADTPPQVFPEKIHAQTLPRYCTVSAIARLVERKLADRVGQTLS